MKRPKQVTAEMRDWAERGEQSVILLLVRGFITAEQARGIRRRIGESIVGNSEVSHGGHSLREAPGSLLDGRKWNMINRRRAWLMDQTYIKLRTWEAMELRGLQVLADASVEKIMVKRNPNPPSPGPAGSARWITQRLPDDEMTVLLRLKDEDWPMMLGWHEDGQWRDTNADEIEDRQVIGWMDLHEAAAILDAQNNDSASLPRLLDDCDAAMMAAGAELWNQHRDLSLQLNKLAARCRVEIKDMQLNK